MKEYYHKILNLFPLVCIIYLLTGCDRKDEDIFQNDNWQTIYQNDDLELYSISFLDKDNGFVMADSSGIHVTNDWKFVLWTEDGGNTWYHITCSTYDTVNEFPLYDIGSIFPISLNVLLTTGDQVHKSIDKGKTWVNVSPQLRGSTINDVHIIDSITWLVAKGNHIVRTNNGGQTWQTVFQTDFMGAFDRFSFPSTNVGYANIGVKDYDHALSAGLILKTIDSGVTWTVMDPEPWKSGEVSIPYICALQFITEEIGYISTFDEYKLYKSIDGGNNWTLVHNNNNSIGLEYFISENIGYYSNGDTIFVTGDGGKKWKIDYYNTTLNSDILTWTFVDTGKGYALTRDHRIIKKIK